VKKVIFILLTLLLLPLSVAHQARAEVTMIARCGVGEVQIVRDEADSEPYLVFKLHVGKKVFTLLPSELNDLQSMEAGENYRIFAHILDNEESLFEIRRLLMSKVAGTNGQLLRLIKISSPTDQLHNQFKNS